jgi:hypothetical protein
MMAKMQRILICYVCAPLNCPLGGIGVSLQKDQNKTNDFSEQARNIDSI